MNEPVQLVSNCYFKGKDYLLKMFVVRGESLEVTVTDKQTGERWTYIETLTHKTGNYKPFDVFVAMLRSGLLKTSECISLDLLGIEDLELLRCKKVISQPHSRTCFLPANSNKRYLILTYSVEFDRIHYPLPMDYCGPPDPCLLQTNIRRLETEIERLRYENSRLARLDDPRMSELQEKVCQLTEENEDLTKEIRKLNKYLSRQNKGPQKQNQTLQSSLKRLEEQLLQERNHFSKTIWKLKEEKQILAKEVQDLKKSETRLKVRLEKASKRNVARTSPVRNRSPAVRLGQNEAHLSCRPISSWSSALQANNSRARTLTRQKRLSSESSLEQQPTRLRPNSDERGNYEAEGARPVRRSCLKGSLEHLHLRKTNLNSYKARSHSGSGQSLENRRTRTNSADSHGSSKSSKCTSCMSKDSNKSTRKKRQYQNIDGSKVSIADLENKIRSIQQLLNDGLSIS